MVVTKSTTSEPASAGRPRYRGGRAPYRMTCVNQSSAPW